MKEDVEKRLRDKYKIPEGKDVWEWLEENKASEKLKLPNYITSEGKIVWVNPNWVKE